MRLTTRLAIIFIACQALVLGLGVYVTYHRADLTVREEFAKRAENTAQNFAQAVGPLICLDSNPENAALVLSSAVDRSEIVYAVIRRGEQTLLKFGEISDPSDPLVSAARFKSNIERNGVFPTYAQIKPCRAADPEMELEIGLDFKAVGRPIRDMLRVQIYSFILEFLLVIGLGLLLGRAIGRRVSAIQAACQKISRGDFSAHVELLGQDEFTEVGLAINQMSESLTVALAERDRQRVELAGAAKLSSLGEMASGIAHEINNPLAILSGKIHLLKTAITQEPINVKKCTENLEKSSQMVDRIARIIRGLKLFSRSGEADPKQSTSLRSIISDSLELCSERFRLANIELRVKLEVDPAIECRATQVSQVLLNLMNNAFDAVEGKPNAWVEISLREDGRSIAILEVTDSGNGIPSEVAAKIMEPFFTTKGVGKGTGLGLSISIGIMKDHGGRLHLDQSCKNTRFCLEFPKLAQAA